MTRDKKRQPGWMLFRRSFLDDWLYKNPERWWRWTVLYMSANYEDSDWTVDDKTIICHRGQCLYSLDSWSQMWNVSKTGANKFLNELKKRRYINRENIMGRTTLITILNYNEEQKGVYDLVYDLSENGARLNTSFSGTSKEVVYELSENGVRLGVPSKQYKESKGQKPKNKKHVPHYDELTKDHHDKKDSE